MSEQQLHTGTDEMQNAIAYYRVSTDRQGKSGLGLEAQQKAVSDFAMSNGFQIVEEFIEVRSGKRNWQYALKAALSECKKTRSVLIIAKLDRLSRSVAFIATLMEANGVTFQIVDYPHADKVIIHFLAAFAEFERDQISKRTKAALAAAKLRGIELGKHGRDVLSKMN